MPSDQQFSELHRLYADPVVRVVNTIAGVGFSIVGGYLAARIAGYNERLNGALSSFLCVAFTLFTIGSISIWLIVGIVGSPLLGLLGGYLRLWQTRK